MTQVVEQGTGRRAKLDGIKVAGKTGTTNEYKDAWFCGFTGNFIGAVWFGNDDDQPMDKMTGGTLPAATWHDIMQFAHSGVDLKPLPGTTLTAEQVARGRADQCGRRADAEGPRAIVEEVVRGARLDQNLMKTTSEKHGAIDLTRPSRYAAAEPAVFARRREAIVDLR